MLSGVKFIPRDQLNTDLGSSVKEKKKKSRKHKKRKNTESDECSSTSESEHEFERSRKHKSKQRKEKERKKAESGDYISDESGGGSALHKEKDLARKGMGLEWMLKPGNNSEKRSVQINDPPEEPQVDEVKKSNPRELNPYFKDDGTGYPEDSPQTKTGANQLSSSSVVGDGGASWRLKALKRAQEQAARDGKKLEEVVGERWGSVSQLAVSAAARAAPIRAHLHAINDRKRMVMKNQENSSEDRVKSDIKEAHGGNRDYLRDVSVRRPEMRQPKVHDSLSWRKRKEQVISTENAQVIAAATASMNKFANDGSFMREAGLDQNKDVDDISNRIQEVAPEITQPSEESPTVSDGLSANQLAAKAMQLRMKGKHDEADKLLEKIEMMKMKQDNGSKLTGHGSKGTASRYATHELSLHKKEREENADRNLAQNIMGNKQFSISGRADDEYDFDVGPSRKKNKKLAVVPEQQTKNSGIGRRITIQQESCQFCLENPSRRKHLTISIADATYLMLPPWQPVVEGHCCILPAQHDSATRNVDDHIWEELRNFKKCLIRMFATQDKEVVFLETVTGLAQQRRHCLVECIPLPQEIAKQAPLYFKKAIDEAEDEWSQHNAKKLIDTSVKGLRGSIPKDFPYFHVEFGLNRGFVHVIDDEKQFKTNLGLNVIRGMLQLPEEDMYRRRQHDSLETQTQAVARFRRDWEPFDWTKQLE